VSRRRRGRRGEKHQQQQQQQQQVGMLLEEEGLIRLIMVGLVRDARENSALRALFGCA